MTGLITQQNTLTDKLLEGDTGNPKELLGKEESLRQLQKGFVEWVLEGGMPGHRRC